MGSPVTKSIDKSIGMLELEETAGHYNACTLLISRLNKLRILWCRTQHRLWVLAGIIFGLSALEFSRFQSGLLMDCHGVCSLALFGWSQAHNVDPCDVPLLKALPSRLPGLVPWSSEPPDPPSSALVAAASGPKYWPAGRALLGQACLGARSRIGKTEGERESCRWGSNAAGKILLSRLGPKDWDLRHSPLLVSSINNGESRSSHF